MPYFTERPKIGRMHFAKSCDGLRTTTIHRLYRACNSRAMVHIWVTERTLPEAVSGISGWLDTVFGQFGAEADVAGQSNCELVEFAVGWVADWMSSLAGRAFSAQLD